MAGPVLELVQSEGAVRPEGHKMSIRFTHEQLDTMIGGQRVLWPG